MTQQKKKYISKPTTDLLTGDAKNDNQPSILPDQIQEQIRDIRAQPGVDKRRKVEKNSRHFGRHHFRHQQDDQKNDEQDGEQNHERRNENSQSALPNQGIDRKHHHGHHDMHHRDHQHHHDRPKHRRGQKSNHRNGQEQGKQNSQIEVSNTPCLLPSEKAGQKSTQQLQNLRDQHRRCRAKYERHCGRGNHLRHKQERGHSSSSSSNSNERSPSSEGENEEDFPVKSMSRLSLDQLTYYQELKQFFLRKNINQKQQFRILNLFQRKFPFEPDRVNLAMRYFFYLDTQQVTRDFSYITVLKVICNSDFDETVIHSKLARIKQKQQQRFQRRDRRQRVIAELKAKGEYYDIEFLKSRALEQIDTAKSIILIDGNNLLNACKTFTRIFRGPMKDAKVNVQTRIKWMCAMAFEPSELILFFDQLYEEEQYEEMLNAIVPAEYHPRVRGVQMEHGDGREADIRIQEVLERFKNPEDPNFKKAPVVITSDLELIQKCYRITPVCKSSGRHFFKFWKKRMFHKYDRSIKKIIFDIYANDKNEKREKRETYTKKDIQEPKGIQEAKGILRQGDIVIQ